MPTLKDTFCAVGDGVADDTAAVQAALDCGERVGIEPGWYRSGPLQLRHGSSLIGMSQRNCFLVSKGGCHADFISTPAGMKSDDVHIECLTIDGNWSGYNNVWSLVKPYNGFDAPIPGPANGGNHQGTGLLVNGVSAKLRDLTIQNVPGVGLWTKGTPDTWRLAGITPHLQNIVIAQTREHGWVHDGPSDIWADSIYPVNNGLGLHRGYYGALIRSNGRFINLHPYNLSNTEIVMAAGCLVESSGNNFANSHFEGGWTPLVISGHSNTVTSTTIYAPRGPVLLGLSGNLNVISATLLGKAGVRGVDLSGVHNILDLVDNGCEAGAINFIPGESSNIIRARGYHGGYGYIGAPHITDEIDLLIGGAGANGRLRRVLAA